ncbi:MAG: MmgE/PrpD family protein, partial [Bacillota bacterium]|nr:MmgE/PrpD family protein [Bacillota bacterium]
MNITKTLIEFALNTKADEIPVDYLKVQNKSLIDAIGTMQAATTQCSAFPAFVEYAKNRNENGPCLVFTTDLKIMPDTAAFVNGTLSHAMDLEDTCQAAVLHSNAVTTPALIALAEYKGDVSGKELLAALLIGSEIACRLSIACGEDLAKHGWYMPPVFGSYGAVLAGCRLLGYDYNQTLDALAANAYAATGLSQMIDDKGSLMRAVRDGFGARAAVQSVLLAQGRPGIGFENVFEGEKGFFKAYSKNGCNPELLVEDLRTKYYASELVMKFWPACLGCHTSIQSTIEV